MALFCEANSGIVQLIQKESQYYCSFQFIALVDLNRLRLNITSGFENLNLNEIEIPVIRDLELSLSRKIVLRSGIIELIESQNQIWPEYIL